jgi:hypothetical protein
MKSDQGAEPTQTAGKPGETGIEGPPSPIANAVVTAVVTNGAAEAIAPHTNNCARFHAVFFSREIRDMRHRMPFTVNVTKRERTRKLKSGGQVTQTRWVVNYKEPRTGQRKQLFFEKKADAHAKRNELLASVETGTYSEARTHITVAAAVENWLDHRRSEVKSNTMKGYDDGARLIIKPLLIGATAQQREIFTKTGDKPKDANSWPCSAASKSTS